MADRDPIAVIGYSYRAPGVGRKDLSTFLERGRSAWSPIPSDRFDYDAYHNSDKDKPGCVAAQGGCFLPDNLYEFDAAFFNLRVEEARTMDPQHRVVLECAFEAAENAGITINQLAGSNIGVFAANDVTEYGHQSMDDLPTTSKYTATAGAACMFANRVSYFFDLEGPSISIDVACAGGSSALHLAVQSIRAGECNTAFVAASNLMLNQNMWTAFDTMGALSESGRCFSYDTKASGFGRGEGAACLLVKRLSDAVRDRDPIHAIVANTACNHGGKTDSITVPSRSSQQKLLQRVHEEIGWSPNDTPVVEGHGTGTKIGDPIEASSISTILAAHRTSTNPVFLGSIKSNIGHTESVSGLLAIIKGILQLQRKQIFPTCGFETMNPAIEWAERLRVVTSVTPWPEHELRRICVSNFGFGGGNAATLLEAYDVGETKEEALQNGTYLFAFSAKSEGSLRTYLSSFREYLQGLESPSLQNLSYTLGNRRSHFTYRSVISAGKIGTLTDGLASDRKLQKVKTLRTAFVFTGQGAQYAEMASGLRRFLEFADALAEAETYLTAFGAPWSLSAELEKSPAESRVNEPDISQPLCTAVQLGLIHLFRAWNIIPNIVTGHSSGEIAAAYAAGFIPFETAMAVSYFRGRAARLVADDGEVDGSMLALGTNAEEAAKFLPREGYGYATVAAINSPRSVTLSGDSAVIEDIGRQAQAQGLFVRPLRVNVAYHSRHLEKVASSYLNEMKPYYRTNQGHAHAISFFSSVTGRQESVETADISYWIRNLVQPVCFLDAITQVLQAQPTVIVEIGPHSALKGPIVQTLEPVQSKPAYLPSLVRGVESIDAVLTLAANMFEAGADVDFAKINDNKGATVVTDLPAYEWNKSESYVHESRITKMKKHLGSPYNSLLGWRSPYTESNDVSFRQVFTLDDMPWLRGHNIAGEVIFPMTGYTSMATEALRSACRSAPDAFTLREFHAKRSLKIEEDEKVEITTKLTPLVTGSNAVSFSAWSFRILTWTGARGWIEHCSGQIDAADGSMPLKSPAISYALDVLEKNELRERDAEQEYAELNKIGLCYGPDFRCMNKVWEAPGVAVHEVSLRQTDDGIYNIASNAPLLDSLLHTTSLIESMSRPRSTLIPTYFRVVREMSNVTLESPAKLTIVTHQQSADEKLGSLVVGMTVFARSLSRGLYPVLEMEDLTVRAIRSANPGASNAGERAEAYDWELVPLVEAKPETSKACPVTVCGALADTQELDFAQLVLDEVSQNSSAFLMQCLNVKANEQTYLIFIDNPRHSILSNVSEQVFSQIQHVMLRSAGVLWVVPDGSAPDAYTMKGFMRSLRIEDASKPFLYLEGVTVDSAGANVISRVANRFSVAEALNEQEFVFSRGELLVPRLAPDQEAEGMFELKPKEVERSLQDMGAESEANTLQMTVDAVGTLDSIYFRRVNLSEELGEDEVVIRVEAAGVNFRDLLLVLGSMPWHAPGLEGVGRVVRVGSRVTAVRPGDRVCYASMQAGFSNYIRIPALFAHPVPDSITSVQMATMPVAYSTAYWCLVRTAQVQAGETVLIHAASGAVGQACITVAQSLGAKIFVTAGTDVKRSFLQKTFHLPKEQIFSSRTPEFRNELLCATQGKGVDVIINSLSGHLLEQTWSAIAEFGRFIEIGKKDLIANSYIGLRPFERNVSFHAIDLRQLFLKRPRVVQKCLVDIIKLLEANTIAPITAVTAVPITDFQAGLKKLQTGQNIGKVVITVSDDDRVFGEPAVVAQPKTLLRADKTYVITGGTGGIGRSLAVWLFEQGAENVVLLGRSGASTLEVKELIRQYDGSSVHLRAIACDVGSRSDLETAILAMKDLPPIGGVIHGALYLRDAFLMNSTWEDWKNVTAPKINAAWHLHELLPNLDFFVCLASIAGVTGNAGQTIYAGTTTFLESFAAHRRKLGLPTISINLPVIDDAGYAKSHNLNELLRLTLGVWLNTPQVHILVRNAIHACQQTSQNQESSRKNNTVSFIRSLDPSPAPLPWDRFEMYAAMKQTSTTTSSSRSSKHDPSSFLEALMERICTLTMVDADEVSPDGDLNDYGLDSLVSVELRNWIRRETGVEVALNQILGMGSLRHLVDFVFQS